jgi:hypothetical protein
MTINDVAKWERIPNTYRRVMPFSVTVHMGRELTIRERAVIQDALVNAAAKIREAEREDENFEWSE